MDPAILFSSNGFAFLIDSCVMDRVFEYSWYGRTTPAGHTYAQRSSRIDGDKFVEQLSHFVFKHPVPGLVIDHINGDSTDNRLSNLQEISYGDNIAKGKDRDSKLGIRGVYKRKSGRFRSYVQVNGVSKYLGTFSTSDEASDVYQKAKKSMRGDYDDGMDEKS